MRGEAGVCVCVCAGRGERVLISEAPEPEFVRRVILLIFLEMFHPSPLTSPHRGFLDVYVLDNIKLLLT